MTLKEYIQRVLTQSIKDTEIEFEVHMWPDGTVADNPTGNKLKFTVFNFHTEK